MSKSIKLTFKQGGIQIATSGFSGGACLKVTEALQANLKAEVLPGSLHYTPEFEHVPTETLDQQTGQHLDQ
jgi:hypothetical protein